MALIKPRIRDMLDFGIQALHRGFISRGFRRDYAVRDGFHSLAHDLPNGRRASDDSALNACHRILCGLRQTAYDAERGLKPRMLFLGRHDSILQRTMNARTTNAPQRRR
jgi:hypothetical protein